MAIGPFQLGPPKHPPVPSSPPDAHGAPFMLELEEVYNNRLIASERLNQISMVLPARRPLRLIQTQVPRRLELDVELASNTYAGFWQPCTVQYVASFRVFHFVRFYCLHTLWPPARPRKSEDSLMRFLRMHLPGRIHRPQVGYKFGSKKTDLLYFWMSLDVSDSLSLPWTEMNSPKLVNLAFVQARTASPSPWLYMSMWDIR